MSIYLHNDGKYTIFDNGFLSEHANHWPGHPIHDGKIKIYNTDVCKNIELDVNDIEDNNNNNNILSK